MNPKVLTLRLWYENFFLPFFHNDASKSTIEQYRITINHWERYTQNNFLSHIAFIDLFNFRSKISDGRAAETVNKNLRHLNHMFTKAGPPGYRNRDALNLIPLTLWVKSLKTYKKKPRSVSFNSIDLMFNACGRMKNADYWRTFLVFAYNTGSRFEAIVNVQDCDVDWANRIVTFRSLFDKCRIERKKPLSLLTLRFLHRLRGKSLLAWKRPKKAFYRNWHRIQRLACLTTEQVFTPHALKRACGSSLAQFASTWAVKYMLDHSQTDVTGSHYIDPIEELRSTIEKLPQPQSFTDFTKGTRNCKTFMTNH